MVVGVTSAIFTPSGGSVGLGFAMPAETIAMIARELEAHGRVQRGYLGISLQPVTDILARALRMETPAVAGSAHADLKLLADDGVREFLVADFQ